MFQIISVGGWLLVTMSAIVFFWLSEPCITRVTSRCSQPPSCVLEVGNERTLVSIKTVKRLLKKLSFAESRKENDIVGASFNEWTESLLVEMQLKAKESLRSRSPFTPVIFHGPSGTGKYSAAKHLAEELAIPYALVSGKALVVESSCEIDALVSWANNFSRGKGTLIFIDQTDAFLSIDSREKPIDKFISVLDGVRRDLFIILATIRSVENIKESVLERCEQIQFSLPDAESRRELLLRYFDEHVQSFVSAHNNPSLLSRMIRFQCMLSIDDGVMTGQPLENIIAGTRGLSRRDIQDLMISLKTSLERSKGEHGRLTYLDVWEVVEMAQAKRHPLARYGGMKGEGTHYEWL